MKKYINRFAFLLVVISACNVSKNIETPKPALPDSFRSAATTGDTTSIGDMQWKSFFTEATLQNLIDSAIVKNYDMQIAVKNIESAQLLFKQVKWNYIPTADLNVSASTDRPSNNSVTGLSLASYNIGTNHIENYQTDVSISWEADIWGKIKNQQRSAFAAYLQTQEAKRAIQTSLVANVSQGYYNLLMLDAQLSIAQSNVRLNDSTLRIIRLQYDAGQVTLLAVQQAQAQQQSAAELIPQFEQNITIQENALRILTGSLPDRIERSSTLDQLTVPENLSASIPSKLISRRPDVRSA